MTSNYSYQFTALRGLQAGRSYYTIMCPLKLVPRIFIFDEEELDPTLRAQRTMNRTRVPDIARYIVNNPEEYCFSSITASVNSAVEFQPLLDGNREVGTLKIPMSASFLVNDGQHRRAAIEVALKERPELGDETISIVLFIDAGLERSQQMFSDLNKHAVKPTMSLGILYDHRDDCAELARNLAEENPTFRNFTEMEKSSISNRSKRLFTLSGIYQATKKLLCLGAKESPTPKQADFAYDYWKTVGEIISDWRAARDGEVRSSELRSDYIHAHGLALQALAILGASLIEHRPRSWREDLKKLAQVDWSRKNSEAWEGRALVAGRVNKTQNHVILTSNYLKLVLGLPLTEREEQLEQAYNRGGRKLQTV